MGYANILGRKVQTSLDGGGGSPAPSTSMAGMGGPGNPSAYRGISGTVGGGGSNYGSMSGYGGSMPSSPVGGSGLASDQSMAQLQANDTNKKQPGIMSRVLDLVSRPGYAVADAFKQAVVDPNRDPNTGGRLKGTDGKQNPLTSALGIFGSFFGDKGQKYNPGGILPGLAAGITGQHKTDFVQINNDPASNTYSMLQHSPILKTAIGLAEGAVSDPSTYLTLGTSKLAEPAKIAAELEKAKLAAQSIKEASLASKLATGVNAGAQGISAIGDVGKARTIAQTIAAGGRTAKLTNETSNAAKLGKGLKVGDIPSKVAQDSKALQLKLAGVPIVSSTKAYTLGRIATDPLRYSGLGQTVADALKAGHTLPAEVHNLMRARAGEGATVAGDTVRAKGKEIQALYKELGITKAQDHELYQAIQRGQAIDTLPKELRPAYTFYKENLAKLAKDGGQTAKDLKFADHAAYKGADVAKGGYDRASVQLAHMYDASIKTRAYADFMKELGQRFPKGSQELKDAIEKSKGLFGTQGTNSAAMSYYIDKAIQPWKSWVTAYRPGFQVKHMIGDFVDANFAGTGVKRFEDSGKVLAKDTKLVDEGAKTISVGDTRVSPSAMDNAYRHNGLEKSSFINTEIADPKQRALGHALSQFTGQREKYTRMATFIHYVDKHMKEGLTFDQAAEQAGAAVRKFHGDFSDLTQFERSLKRVIPFYGYTKKELPLLMEQLFTNPHKITQYSRLGQLASTIAGVQHDSANPFPGIDQVVPSWMSQHMIVPTGPNRALTPNLPIDHLSWLDPMSAIKQAEGMVNPLIKAPIELARGKTFEGIPIRKSGSKSRSKWGSGTPGESNASADARYGVNYLPYGSFANQSKTSTTDKLISLMTGMGEHTVKGKTTKASKW